MAFSAPRAADLECRGCNVILISLDALRADFVGTYGHPQNVTPNFVASIDIMPTVLEALGMEIPSGAEGISLLPLLAGGERAERPSFGEWRGDHVVRDSRFTYILRRPDSGPRSVCV